jgi:hypothetical protein
MEESDCPICKSQQFSRFDKIYLQQNGNCWECDCKNWKESKITLEEFEKRERKAQQAI